MFGAFKKTSQAEPDVPRFSLGGGSTVGDKPANLSLSPAPATLAVAEGQAQNDSSASPSPAPSQSTNEPSQLRQFGGIFFAPTVIERQPDLAGIVFDSIVNEELKLAPHLYSRFAIAKLNATEQKVLLFTVKDLVTSDDVKFVKEHILSRGYSFPTEGRVQGHYLSSTLVTSLSQKTLTMDNIRMERRIRDNPAQSALMSAFTDIIDWAYVNGADDIDFAVSLNQPRSQIAFKIGGKYVRPERHLHSTDTVIQMLGIAYQKSIGSKEPQFETRKEQQAQIELDLPPKKGDNKNVRVRLRWSGLSIDAGTVVTMRLQRLGGAAKIKSLKEAGYLDTHLEILNRVIHSEGGCTTFSGVVGSGKSTSLVSLLGLLPRTLKIQTIEDPVELELPFAYQKTVTRDLTSTGADPGFVSAVRGLYRSAMDVLYLGEIRDPETGLVARSVAESGHSVYTTTHARSALGVFDRFASQAIGIPREVLATPDIIKLNVYQALMPVSCPNCKKKPSDFAHAMGLKGTELDEHNKYFDLLYDLYAIHPDSFMLVDPNGCEHCRNPELPELNGFSGRTVVAEMIEPDEQMLEYVLKCDNISLQRYWRSWAPENIMDPNMNGRTTMECAVHKAGLGIIDPREIEGRFQRFTTVAIKRKSAEAYQMSKMKAGALA